jgi:hypothetical protein
MKNPLTPAGIKPEILRFVAQHFNHCATAVPLRNRSLGKISIKPSEVICRLEFVLGPGGTENDVEFNLKVGQYEIKHKTE